MIRAAGCALSLLMGSAGGQERVRDSRSYFPLEPGQKWTMRVTDSSTKGSTDWHYEVLGQVDVKGGKCWEIRGRAEKVDLTCGSAIEPRLMTIGASLRTLVQSSIPATRMMVR